jgi:uncharacterized protein (TIGR00251 family)
LNIRVGSNGVILEIKAGPGAQKSSICGEYGGALKVKVAAPADKGKANRELEEFLAVVFGISKSRVEVVSGKASRQKQVLLRGMTEKAAAEIVKKILKQKQEDI